MKDLISVVIPVYKVPFAMLSRCVNSVINQSYTNLEVILVDDGSPDDCPKYCDDFAKKDKRIKVIHQKNKGLAGARNSGLDNSFGKYIMFIDGDDYIDLDSLERLYKYSTNDDYDIIRGMFYKDYGTRIEKFPCQNIKLNKSYINEEIFELKNNVLNFNSNISSVCGCLYKTSLLHENKIYNDQKLKQGSEDIEFSFRFYDYVKKAIVVEEYFYHYIYNDDSISTKSTDENNYRVLSCFNKILDNIDRVKDFNKKSILLETFNIRMQYVIVTSMISSYFNPMYELKYADRKKLAKKFLKNLLVKKSFKLRYIFMVDLKRIIVLIAIKLRFFDVLFLLGKLRSNQKHN